MVTNLYKNVEDIETHCSLAIVNEEETYSLNFAMTNLRLSN
jgi:hypothetical protein